MKKTFLKYGIAFAAIVLMYACSKKDGITNQPYDAYGVSGTQGLLKVNLAFAYTVDYSTIRIKVNGKTVSSSLQTRQPFPGGGFILGEAILPCIFLFLKEAMPLLL